MSNLSLLDDAEYLDEIKERTSSLSDEDDVLSFRSSNLDDDGNIDNPRYEWVRLMLKMRETPFPDRLSSKDNTPEADNPITQFLIEHGDRDSDVVRCTGCSQKFSMGKAEWECPRCGKEYDLNE